MGVVSEYCCKEVYIIIIDILIIIMTFPYSTCISSFFGSIIPISLFILKMFFRSCYYKQRPFPRSGLHVLKLIINDELP